MADLLASLSLDDTPQAKMKVDLKKPVLCPLLKSGAGGQLPAPEQGRFYKNVDLRSSAQANPDWDERAQCGDLLGNTLQLVDAGDGGCFLDTDRRTVATELSFLLWDLDHYALEGNCHGRIILGQKGTGKSTFMQALAISAQSLCAHTVAIYADVGTIAAKMDPCGLILEAFSKLLPGGRLPPAMVQAGEEHNIGNMLELVKRLGLCVLLLLDEYPSVYSLPKELGRPWVEQIYCLGNDGGSNLNHMIVLSGSAPYMRSMCFGKLDLDLQRYPSYFGRSCNLNSDRFGVLSLGPILDKKDLKLFLEQQAGRKRIQRSIYRNPQELSAFFIATGGVHRKMEHAITRLGVKSDELDKEQSIPYQVTKHLHSYGQLWEAMLKYLSEQLDSSGSKNTNFWENDPWQLLVPIPWSTLPTVKDMQSSQRYAAADDGAVVYQQTTAGDTVRFVFAYQPMLLLARDEDKELYKKFEWFSPYMQICLRFPYGVLGIDAEEALRMSMLHADSLPPLAALGSGLDKIHRVAIESYEKTTLKVAFKGKLLTSASFVSSEKVAIAFQSSSIAQFPYGCPLNESPDKCGADIVMIDKDDECLTMHRIQVKLGDSVFGKDAATKVTSKHSSGNEQFIAFLKKHVSTPVKIQNYLATTRRMTKTARQLCELKSVWILDRNALANVWAPCIIEWAKASKLAQYLPATDADPDDGEDSAGTAEDD